MFSPFRKLIKQCCWHNPTIGIKEFKFSACSNIIRLFWTVVDSEAVYVLKKSGIQEEPFNEIAAKKYFKTLLKRTGEKSNETTAGDANINESNIIEDKETNTQNANINESNIIEDKETTDNNIADEQNKERAEKRSADEYLLGASSAKKTS